MKNTLTIYKDQRGEWRWRLRSHNSHILADGGEGYRRKANCLHMAQKLFPGTPLVILPLILK